MKAAPLQNYRINSYKLTQKLAHHYFPIIRNEVIISFVIEFEDVTKWKKLVE